MQVKSSAKEEDFLTYTPNDILFLLGDIIWPVGLILNHSAPSECFVLFPSAAPMQDIYSLNESPSWVGALMQLAIKKPYLSIHPIVTKLLEDKALEVGEEYEYIPIEPLGPKVLEVLGHILLLKEEMSLLPLPWLNSLKTWHHRNIRTNIPKLSAFSGERAKSEVSIEQWSYELQTIRKTYSDSALREGIQHSLRGAAADTVCNMGPNVPLDTIIKKFTIVYGNVKSFDLLIQDFYHADQGEEETIPSFATQIEGLLFQIRRGYQTNCPTKRNRGS